MKNNKLELIQNQNVMKNLGGLVRSGAESEILFMLLSFKDKSDAK